MTRRPSSRLAALGLLILLQFGTIGHLEHMGCFVDVGTSQAVSHGGMDMASSPMPGMADMAGHHGQDADPEHPMDGAESCCDGPCVCPQVQSELGCVGALSALAVPSPARHLLADGYTEPTLAPTPHLLPLPNPPPAA
jgi:hypothetical protein